MPIGTLPVSRAIAVELAIRDAAGEALPREEIVVEQRRHGFRFGCTGFEAIPLANGELTGPELAIAERIQAHWLDLFNVATLPFYWARFEPHRGEPDTERLLAAADWFRARGVALKGHPLCWHTHAAPWLLQLSTSEIEAAQRARIRRDVTAFAGRIDTWDAINEAVIMPVFEKEDNGITRLSRELGRLGMIELAFGEARAANPAATLLINDFDLSAAYERLIEASLEAGVTIDAIGIQSHMHQGYWGEERTLEILERFGRFGLPLHWTETTIVSGELMPPEIVDLNDHQVDDWPTTPEGELRQADEVVRHYQTLFGHPAVEAITWWGLPDGGWLNAPAGLVRIDGSPKPAFFALRGLIRGDWWLPPTPLVTDEGGHVRFGGAPGQYAVSARGSTAGVSVGTAGPARLELRFPISG